MRAFRFVFLLILLVPLQAFAVSLTMGNEVATPNAGDSNPAVVRTDIDLGNPASHTGSVSTAKVYWSQAGCANAFKIKFFHRFGDTLTLTAERGPFTPSTNLYTATLSPAVNVAQGDLIGVTRLAACGNAATLSGIVTPGYLQYGSDVSGTVFINAGTKLGGVLAVSASGTATEWMARVIPVVGSLPGLFGSQFKTEMQFFNPQSSGTMTAKVIFHPMGTAGSTGDPTRLVTLGPGEIFSTPDVVAAMGQSGIGSLDVSVPAGQGVPMMLTRVYNDAGANGTSSLTEEAIPSSDAITTNSNVLAAGVTGYLITPRNPSQTRFNIGVRTLYSGATINVTVRNAAGVVVRTITQTYTANFFTQVDAAAFTGGAIAADQSIQITVSSGSAIVYGATTDNTTNDPAVQFVYGVFAIA